ncbi:MAG TPA: arginine--tRNA ligase [Chitinophagales bacterium]|nr:arginine--tRNA ligase [Chitinophagales bacterium]
MMELIAQLKKDAVAVVNKLYNQQVDATIIKIDKTPPEFTGELTLVIFPFVKISKKNPEVTANEIGEALMAINTTIAGYNVVKGFLNISFTDAYWSGVLQHIHNTKNYGVLAATGKKVVLEYCGPNTNKPLHLGHVRNVLLGYAAANILAAAGHEVHKVNILNDRGIAICKSMVAYERNGNGSTPASTGIKGDHFVGHYYIEFAKIHEAEMAALIAAGKTKEEAEKNTPIYLAAQEMLRKWEAGDTAVLDLWNTMNNWVYEGFGVTYQKIGIDFEKEYKESEFYLHGKKMVQEGLTQGAFFKKEDGSIWVDLTSDGLDQKVLLRADGTSMYITQDMGVAEARYGDFKMDTSVYVVANEQDYHFKVLKLVLQKLGRPYGDGIYHLSYGMVDLPEGKMKSREGTVVDADDLISEMTEEAKTFLATSEKSAAFNEEEKQQLAEQIGLSALKYFILKVDPKKRILFNPKESIDLQGHTGPFIQYSYARIQSIFRKLAEVGLAEFRLNSTDLLPAEKSLIVNIYQYPGVIQSAADNYSPAEVANYIYNLAKQFNSFYAEHSITKAESADKQHLRAIIAGQTAYILKHGLMLLGIQSPERM